MFFYAIFDNEDKDTVTAIDGPFETKEIALDNAFLNCCTGEPGDPVFEPENAIAGSNGRFKCECDGETAVVAISDNAGCFRR